MKSKFGSFDFGSVEVLSRAEEAKVKGGAYGAGEGVVGSSGCWPAWNCPGYVSPSGSGSSFPNPGGTAMCYINVNTGALSTTNNGFGWEPTSKSCTK